MNTFIHAMAHGAQWYEQFLQVGRLDRALNWSCLVFVTFFYVLMCSA